jgi:NADH pyrophosphatase NudC (nudix superfamily)
MSDKPKPDLWNQFRIAMPRQFTRQTKFCARCGQRVKWDEKERALVCPRCKRSY